MNEKNFEDNVYMKLMNKGYYVLMTNLLLAGMLIPLIVAVNLLAIDWRNLFWFLLASVPFGIGVITCFATVEGFIESGSQTPIKDFIQAMRLFLKQGLTYWLSTSFILGIIGADMLFLMKQPKFFYFSGVFVILAGLVLALFIHCCYFQIRNPEHGKKDVLRISAFYIVKKWYVSIINVLLFLLMAAAVIMKPSIGLLVLPYLFIILIYLNCRKLHNCEKISSKGKRKNNANNGNSLYS